MTDNKPELYELSALMQQQAEVIEQMADKARSELPTLGVRMQKGDDLWDLGYATGFHLEYIYTELRWLNMAIESLVLEQFPESNLADSLRTRLAYEDSAGVAMEQHMDLSFPPYLGLKKEPPISRD